MYKILKKVFCFCPTTNSYEFCINFVDKSPYSVGLKYELYWFRVPLIIYYLWSNEDHFKAFYFHKLEAELEQYLLDKYKNNVVLSSTY